MTTAIGRSRRVGSADGRVACRGGRLCPLAL